MFLEYFVDEETGNPQYIEANPRIGETVNARLSGVNLAEALIRVALGERCEELAPGRPGVRSHLGFIWLVSQAQRGASRRELFRQWCRMRMRHDSRDDTHNEMTRPSEDWLSRWPATGTMIRLIARPGSASSLIERTVGNYSLPQSAVEEVEGLPDDYVSRHPLMRPT
jgi:hypothetical protein